MLLYVFSQCSIQADEILDVLYNKIFRCGVLQPHLFNVPQTVFSYAVFLSLNVFILAVVFN